MEEQKDGCKQEVKKFRNKIGEMKQDEEVFA